MKQPVILHQQDRTAATKPLKVEPYHEITTFYTFCI